MANNRKYDTEEWKDYKWRACPTIRQANSLCNVLVREIVEADGDSWKHVVDCVMAIIKIRELADLEANRLLDSDEKMYEELISSPERAFEYAKNVLGGRFEYGEEVMKKDKKIWARYQKEVLKKGVEKCPTM